jgi:subtilisin family serine protease
VRVVSRWLNAVSVEAEPAALERIRALPFVASVRPVASRPAGRRLAEPVQPAPQREAPSPEDLRTLSYGDCSSQILPIQVDQLHDAGLSGAGVLVCILDTGFLRTHDCLDSVQVVAEHDFVQGDGVTSNQPGDEPGQHNHGTYVLSLLGGWDPGHLIGPAYGATFALGKTETIASETSVEEDWWAAGAEWADSLGADVLSSSLGYKDWYTYADLDGNTAVVTIAADLAVANGIAVFNSAGNEGDDDWFHVIAPADGDSVVAVGAVDSLGAIASFSSHGPTADGRTKPDVCAMGKGNLVALPSDDHGYGRGSGTSFSNPLVAGVAALLLQAHPSWTPVQLREALRTTATRAGSPDNTYGWGVVQAAAAAAAATSAPGPPEPIPGARMWATPNPCRGETAIRFELPPSRGPVDVTIHDVAGRRVRTLAADVVPAASGRFVWDGRDDDGRPVPAGVWFARIDGPAGTVSTRVVTLR